MHTPPQIHNLNERKVFLASGSPRRRELLSFIVPDFEIAETRQVNESYPADLAATPEKVAPFLSALKAKAYSHDLSHNCIIITADTIVIAPDGTIMGKPHDANDAIAMLKALSGKTHRVVTGVTLTSKERRHTFSETTEVTFAPLSDAEIETYVKKFNPLDKAGAYGIQEWIGCIGVESIKGCFYNVMGLPLHRLYTELKHF